MNQPFLRVEASDLPAEQLLRETGVLAVLDFDPALVPGSDARHMVMPLRHQGGPRREVWRGAGPVVAGIEASIRYSQGAELTLGTLCLPLGAKVAADTRRAYAELFAFLRRQPHPHLQRCWNYFAGITTGEGDQERYRQFVLGRFEAYAAQGLDADSFPAATAIGGPGEALFLMFIAGAQPPQVIENPRQTSAFAYPRQYGPKSPSFARAVRSGDSLLVSGTASVVGHASRHDDDWRAQVDEILTNLDALCRTQARQARPQCLRLYLRAGLPAEQVQAYLQEQLGEPCPLLILEGDICRDDLLLEIEGVWRD